MPPGDVAPVILTTMLAICAAVVLVLRGPVGRAMARRIEGGAGGSAELERRVADLEHRLAESEQDRLRVAELEERLDFAERLLARHEPGAPRELPR